MTTGRRIVLGEDDFRDESTPQAQTPASASAGLPPVTRSAPVQIGGAGTPAMLTPETGSLMNDARVAAVVSAAVAMLFAWALTEGTSIVTLGDHAHSQTALNAYVGLWTGMLELVFVAVIVGFDRAIVGAWDEAIRRAARGALPAVAIGFIAGFAAQAAYSNMLEAAFKAGDYSPDSARLYFARAVGWAIFGCGAGLTIGIVDRASRRALNGAIGGAIGGAVGGFVFQYAGVHMHSSGGFSRLLGLSAIAVLVAIATHAVEAVRKEAWLRIIGGGMAGKEFILYHAVTRLGSSPDCEIYLLKDPAIEPLHAQIQDRGAQRHLSASPAAPVLVNNSPTTSHVLRNGDVLQLGKTVIAYQERASARLPA
jgi:hypothetical protein